MNTQAETISRKWLTERGYTVASAARRIGRSTAHVHRVITGERESAAVTQALRQLPQRPFFIPRERLTATR